MLWYCELIVYLVFGLFVDVDVDVDVNVDGDGEVGFVC